LTGNSARSVSWKGRKPARPKDALISIIAPCYNEDESVEGFAQAVLECVKGGGFEVEILFVDDGSLDDTRAKLFELSRRDAKIRVLALTRNFGKEAALTAGLDHARGDAVIVMDVDLQDPPELIAEFVKKWREGYDVVYAKRDNREADTLAKRFTAEGFYRLFNSLSEIKIPEDAGDYRLMDRRVVETMKTLSERSRFMKGLFAWAGYRAAAVPYVRPARAAGATKFNFWRLWNFALDGIVSFSTAPLRVWSYVGLFIAAISFIYASWIILLTLVSGNDVPGYASLLTFVLFFGGVQMFSTGVLGEYIARLFVEAKHRPIYVVDEIYESEEASSRRGDADLPEQPLKDENPYVAQRTGLKSEA
jgi:glycosyltransferase involved in cell wall biosynthesis